VGTARPRPRVATSLSTRCLGMQARHVTAGTIVDRLRSLRTRSAGTVGTMIVDRRHREIMGIGPHLTTVGEGMTVALRPSHERLRTKQDGGAHRLLTMRTHQTGATVLRHRRMRSHVTLHHRHATTAATMIAGATMTVGHRLPVMNRAMPHRHRGMIVGHRPGMAETTADSRVADLSHV
jgi:hypothetical protein